MKKRLLLGLVASSVVVSFANAGVVKGSVDNKAAKDLSQPSSQTIGKEFLNAKNGKADINESLNVVYSPSTIKLNALKNPVLNITFSGASNVKVNTGVGDK